MSTRARRSLVVGVVVLALGVLAAAPAWASSRSYLGAGRFYQPTVYVNHDDGFWPASFLNVLSLQWDGRYTCRISGKRKFCGRAGRPLSIRGLKPGRGRKKDHLDYPASAGDIDDQRKSFQQNVNGPGSARTYFFAGYGRSKAHTIASFQYWFFYNFNYVATSSVFRGYHEGDFEQFSILFRSKRVRVGHRIKRYKVPKYAFFSQHSGGELVKWNSSKVQHSVVPLGGGKSGYTTRVFAAKGTHANYKDCGTHYRFAPRDVSECDNDKRFAFRPPLIPLRPKSWSCWRGHVGNLQAGPPGRYADGPGTPLQQQKFFDRTPKDLCSRYASASSSRATAAAASASAASATERLFDDCRDWQRAPAGPGSKLVACDEGVLDRFFRSGLRDPGPERLRVTGPGLPADDADPPAVVESGGPAGTARARIATDRAVSPTVYAADRLRDGTLMQARFPDVALRPGTSARLVRGESVWAVVDGSGRVLAQRVPEVVRRPVAPATQIAVRRRAGRVAVTGHARGTDADRARYYLVGARSRRELRRKPALLARLRMGGGGRIAGSARARGGRWFQVVAYRRGAERASNAERP